MAYEALPCRTPADWYDSPSAQAPFPDTRAGPAGCGHHSASCVPEQTRIGWRSPSRTIYVSQVTVHRYCSWTAAAAFRHYPIAAWTATTMSAEAAGAGRESSWALGLSLRSASHLLSGDASRELSRMSVWRDVQEIWVWGAERLFEQGARPGEADGRQTRLLSKKGEKTGGSGSSQTQREAGLWGWTCW